MYQKQHAEEVDTVDDVAERRRAYRYGSVAASLHVAICSRRVKITSSCRGPELLASVHEASQSLDR